MRRTRTSRRSRRPGGAHVVGALTALGLGASALAGPAGAERPAPRIERWGDGALEVVSGEVLVRLAPQADRRAFDAALGRIGGRVLDAGQWSRVMRVAGPQGVAVGELLAQVRALPFVQDASPNAIVTGAGGSSLSSTLSATTSAVTTTTTTVTTAATQTVATAASFVSTTVGNLPTTCQPKGTPKYLLNQWNLPLLGQTEACLLYPAKAPNVVVAVLDTGVAYASGSFGGVSYLEAPGLKDIPIIAPWDFINGDPDALDDHGHGTHMAGTIASQGDALGAFPGVAIMPVKVLAKDKAGTEHALIEGIHYAVDQGAEVLSLSLSFGIGYYPSPALQDAIGYAVDKGVVVVSSSGNEGRTGVGYPAAMPEVLAVGASRMGQDLDALAQGKIVPLVRRAEYSNQGYALDVVAPGGRIDSDFNFDGMADGILAESFTPGQPSTLGQWLFTGTSPAAAEAAASAAWLLADGRDPAQVPLLLAQSATAVDGQGAFAPGAGSGEIQIALARATGDVKQSPMHVNLMSWLEDAGGGQLRAGVRAVVIDDHGARQSGVTLAGSFYGSVTAPSVSAVTGGADGGIATLYSPPFPPGAAGTAVGFQVDAVARSGEKLPWRPTQFYSLSPAMAEGLSQMLEDEELAASMLLFSVSPGDPALSPIVGDRAIPSYLLKPVGPGLRSGALVMTVDEAFIKAQAGAVSHEEVALSWPLPLASGWGEVDGIRADRMLLSQPAVDMPPSLVALPLDPALIGLDLGRDYPVINDLTARFEATNRAFGDQLPAEPMQSGFAHTSWGPGFASATLGDAFASSSIGNAFAASPIGNAFASSSIGNAFAASPIGNAFASSSIGNAFAASPIGMSSSSTSTSGGSGGSGGKGSSAGNGSGSAAASSSGAALYHYETELPK